MSVAPSYVDEETIAQLLPPSDLIERLKEAFTEMGEPPMRHHHRIDHERGCNTLLLMPAWNAEYLGLKVVLAAPANAEIGLPSLSSTYTLFEKVQGRALAQFDGNAITARRTAAASALAASFLARQDATTMLVVGTGRVASLLPAAYRAVLPIRRVLIHSRSPQRASQLVEELRTDGFDASVCPDVESGLRLADIVSCATLAEQVVLQGDWLHAGQLIDLIGSYQPHAREADDKVIARSRIVIDTTAALAESGDLVIPAQTGMWSPDSLHATLGELCSGAKSGRQADDEIWLFKSVGTAIEDLTAAQALHDRMLLIGRAHDLLTGRSPS